MKCSTCGAAVLIFWDLPGWRIVASACPLEDGELVPWPASLPGLGHWWCAECQTAGMPIAG